MLPRRRVVPPAGRTRLATYANAADAGADRERREANARQRVNPFSVAEVGELTTMPLRLFLDLLGELGLRAPTHEYPGWFGWWATLGGDQRSRLWEAFDRLRFYEVIAELPRPLGYAVLELYGTGDAKGMYYLSDEGGIVRGVYRDREKADRSHFQRFMGCRVRWLPADADPLEPETHWRA